MRGQTLSIFAFALTAAVACAGTVLFAGTVPSPATQPGGTTSQTDLAAPVPPATRTADQKRQDDINRVMEFFRVTQPDVYDQAKSLRKSDSARFDKLIMGALPTVNRMEGIRKRSQKLFDLSMQDLKLGYMSLRIAHELKRTDLSDADRKLQMDQLKTVVAAEFETQQQIRQFEIDDLQQKVKDLDTQVKDREQGKGAIQQKRVEDLVERNPRLEW